MRWPSGAGSCMAKPRKRILCIEDDRKTAALIAEELADREFEVSTACDGQEGFVAILKDKPNLEVGLILQDCNKTLLTVACSADLELPVGQLLSDQRSRFAVVLDAQNSLARLCHAAPRAGWPTHYGPACSVRVAHSGKI